MCLHVQIKDHFKNDISTLYIHFFHSPDTTLKLYSTEVGPSSDFQGERSGFFLQKQKNPVFFYKNKKDPFFLKKTKKDPFFSIKTKKVPVFFLQTKK